MLSELNINKSSNSNIYYSRLRATLHLKWKEIELRLSVSAFECMHDLLRIKVPQSEFLRLYHNIRVLRSLRNGEVLILILKDYGMPL